MDLIRIDQKPKKKQVHRKARKTLFSGLFTETDCYKL